MSSHAQGTKRLTADSFAYEWEKLIGKCNPITWASGARIVSRPQADRWTVLVSIQRNECTMRPEIRWLDLSVQRTETT